MNRKRRLTYNILFGLIGQAVTIICGFILPRFMLESYGSEVNGLISSIAQFIGFISFADLGVISVVQSSLYEPLRNNNNDDVSRILISANRFFRKIALILIVYIVVLIFIYPQITDGNFDFGFTSVLIIAISVDSFFQYFICLSHRILLSADQKNYIYLILTSTTLIINTSVGVLLMLSGASVVAVKLASAAIFIIQPVFLNIYVKKHYKFNMKLKLDGEPIKQKWNGFAQHIAFIVLQNTDVVVLTVFSTLINVSIYQMYYFVIAGVYGIINAATTGVSPLFGNMLAGNEDEAITNTFNIYEWLFHTFVTVIFTCTAILIVPFVQVYTSGITDADYIAPVFAVLLSAAYYILSLRMPYQGMILAAGHYKQTQTSSLIEAGINVSVSVILVIKLGLVGVAIGTIAAMTYRTLYLVYYLKRNILNRSPRHFYRNIVNDVFVALISYFVTFGVFNITLADISYVSWFFMAVKVLLITILAALFINLIFNRRLIKNTLGFFKKSK